MKRVLCIAFPEWPLQRLHAAPPVPDAPSWPPPPASTSRPVENPGPLSRAPAGPASCATPPPARARPLVLYAEHPRHGLCVTCCSHAAAQRGIAPGMRLAEAEGLAASGGRNSARPRFVPHDFDADAAGLQQLAHWGQRFTPVVGLEPPDSLLLDVTGCGHLFGDEHGLVRQALTELRQRGFAPRLALADTLGLAWGLAHYGSRWTQIVPPGRRDLLAPLPVEALRLPPETAAALHELDLRRIAQLLALPRASLPSRFGPELLQRLDQALGEVPEPIVPFRPVEPLAASCVFPEPTADIRTLNVMLERTLAQLLERLALRRAGIQRLEVELDCSPLPPVMLTIGLLLPSADAPHLLDLLQTRLEQTPLSGEVHALHLRALDAPPLDMIQTELLDDGNDPFSRDSKRSAPHTSVASNPEWTRLVDRLSNRLGKEAVVQPRLIPDPQPERAFRWEPLLDARRPPTPRSSISSRPPRPPVRGAHPDHREGRGEHCPRSPRPGQGLAPLMDAPGDRPLRLFAQPEAVQVVSIAPDGPPLRFTSGGRTLHVLRSWGPERIETGWWRGAFIRRDYYRVETTEGRRFWLFRRLREGDWFLHGEFE